MSKRGNPGRPRVKVRCQLCGWQGLRPEVVIGPCYVCGAGRLERKPDMSPNRRRTREDGAGATNAERKG